MSRDTNSDNAQSAVRSAASSTARAQGGTNLSGQPVHREAGTMEELAKGGRENTDSMGDGNEDWSTRDDQPGYFDYH